MSYCTHLKEQKTSKCFGVLQGLVPGPVVLFIMLFRLSIVLSRGLHPKTVLDSGFRNSLWNLDSGFQSLAGFLNHGAGFHISKPWILNSRSKNFPNSRFQKQQFSGFLILRAKIYRIRDSTSRNLLDSGIHCQKFPWLWNLDYLTSGE